MSESSRAPTGATLKGVVSAEPADYLLSQTELRISIWFPAPTKPFT